MFLVIRVVQVPLCVLVIGGKSACDPRGSYKMRSKEMACYGRLASFVVPSSLPCPHTIHTNTSSLHHTIPLSIHLQPSSHTGSLLSMSCLWAWMVQRLKLLIFPQGSIREASETKRWSNSFWTPLFSSPEKLICLLFSSPSFLLFLLPPPNSSSFTVSCCFNKVPFHYQMWELVTLGSIYQWKELHLCCL